MNAGVGNLLRLKCHLAHFNTPLRTLVYKTPNYYKGSHDFLSRHYLLCYSKYEPLYRAFFNEVFKPMTTVSVIIPCYRSAPFLEETVGEILDAFAAHPGYQPRIILVDDASGDGTDEVIRSLSAAHREVEGVFLSENRGQAGARMAGIRRAGHAPGVFMDDDGQHPPEDIFRLLAKLRKGYDLVYAQFPYFRDNGEGASETEGASKDRGRFSVFGEETKPQTLPFNSKDREPSPVFALTRRFKWDKMKRPHMSRYFRAVPSVITNVLLTVRGKKPPFLRVTSFYAVSPRGMAVLKASPPDTPLAGTAVMKAFGYRSLGGLPVELRKGARTHSSYTARSLVSAFRKVMKA